MQLNFNLCLLELFIGYVICQYFTYDIHFFNCSQINKYQFKTSTNFDWLALILRIYRANRNFKKLSLKYQQCFQEIYEHFKPIITDSKHVTTAASTSDIKLQILSKRCLVVDPFTTYRNFLLEHTYYQFSN